MELNKVVSNYGLSWKKWDKEKVEEMIEGNLEQEIRVLRERRGLWFKRYERNQEPVYRYLFKEVGVFVVEGAEFFARTFGITLEEAELMKTFNQNIHLTRRTALDKLLEYGYINPMDSPEREEKFLSFHFEVVTAKNSFEQTIKDSLKNDPRAFNAFIPGFELVSLFAKEKALKKLERAIIERLDKIIEKINARYTAKLTIIALERKIDLYARLCSETETEIGIENKL